MQVETWLYHSLQRTSHHIPCCALGPRLCIRVLFGGAYGTVEWALKMSKKKKRCQNGCWRQLISTRSLCKWSYNDHSLCIHTPFAFFLNPADTLACQHLPSLGQALSTRNPLPSLPKCSSVPPSTHQVTAKLSHFIDGQSSCFCSAEAPLPLFLSGQKHRPLAGGVVGGLLWTNLMVRHLNVWIACCHLLLFMSLHELVSLNVLSWHELSISISIPRASKFPMFNETWNPHHPSSLVAVPRGFRTTKTGRVSGGGDNSTRRMRPKGSSYAGSHLTKPKARSAENCREE